MFVIVFVLLGGLQQALIHRPCASHSKCRSVDRYITEYNTVHDIYGNRNKPSHNDLGPF